MATRAGKRRPDWSAKLTRSLTLKNGAGAETAVVTDVVRKRRILNGPREFREMREDLPKRER